MSKKRVAIYYENRLGKLSFNITSSIFNFFLFMDRIMNTFMDSNKILNPIVISFAINMMNKLKRLKFPTKMFFHYNSVFTHPSCASPYFSVSTSMMPATTKFPVVVSTFPERMLFSFNLPTRRASDGTKTLFAQHRFKELVTKFARFFDKFFHNLIVSDGRTLCQ